MTSEVTVTSSDVTSPPRLAAMSNAFVKEMNGNLLTFNPVVLINPLVRSIINTIASEKPAVVCVLCKPTNKMHI